MASDLWYTPSTSLKTLVYSPWPQQGYMALPPAPPAPPPASRAPYIPRRLPPELLDMIFQCAVPPSFLLDHSLIAGPTSPWCKARDMRLSLVLVSRDWYSAGIRLLYQDVVFRRLNQIPAFLETLQASPAAFGSLVKKISLDMLVSVDYGRSFTRNIQQIVDLCPRLEGLTLSSLCPLPQNATFPVMKSTLKHLKAGASVSSVEFFTLLKTTCKSLTSLSIHVHVPVEEFSSAATYNLPELRSLIIQVPPSGVDSWIHLHRILTMPKLERLTIELLPGSDTAVQSLFKWDNVLGRVISFCRLYPNLKYLDINPGFRRKSDDIRGILAVCPNLEQIVVYNGVELDFHPKIRWIDICTSKMFGSSDISQPAHDASLDRLKSSITRTTFPSLQGTRHIHLCSPHFDSISTHLPPDCVTSPSCEFEYNFAGIYLRHNVGSIDTKRHVDVEPAYAGPLFHDFDYDPAQDPDDARSDGTTMASERSLKMLRRRELRQKKRGRRKAESDEDDTSSCSSSPSDCTIKAELQDTESDITLLAVGRMLR